MTMGGAVKYLSFLRCGIEYAVPLGSVRKVVGMIDESKMPKIGPGGYGITDVLGDRLNIIDPCGTDAEPPAYTSDTCILVVGGRHDAFGIITDRLAEILKLPHDDEPEQGDQPWMKSARMTDSLDRSKTVRIVDTDILYRDKFGQV